MQPTYAAYLWHDDVHRQRESARPSFWRLQFVPEYDVGRILTTLHGIFRDSHITSYVVYETLGDFDLLVRLRGPKELDPEDFRFTLESALQLEGVFSIEYMVVTKTDLHWAWRDPETGGMRLPRPSTELSVSNEQAQRITEYNRDIVAWVREATKDDLLDPDQVQHQNDLSRAPIPPSWIRDYEDAHLLRPISLIEPGINFYITFDHPVRTLKRPQKDDVLVRIRRECEQVAAQALQLGHTTSFPQMSLYEGYGTMSEFLIFCRAPDRHFYHFMRRLVFGLLGERIAQLYKMRTYTHVIADRNFLELQEYPITTEEVILDESLLDQPESESVEFKASVALDVRKYLQDEIAERNGKVEEGVYRTICGFLNAPEGGILVIGALEIARELERIKVPEPVYLELLSSKGLALSPPHEADTPLNPATKALLGLNVEMGLKMGFTDEDTFIRRLVTQIADRIQPNPMNYINIKTFQVGDKLFGVVQVKASELWYYMNSEQGPKFLVRELARTRPYEGVEGEYFRRMHPRQGLPWNEAG
jgi:hypothetical protein